MKWKALKISLFFPQINLQQYSFLQDFFKDCVSVKISSGVVLTLWREKFCKFLLVRTFSYLFLFILVFSFFFTRFSYIYSYFSFLSFTFDNFLVFKRIHIVKHSYLIGIAERVLDILPASERYSWATVFL